MKEIKSLWKWIATHRAAFVCFILVAAGGTLKFRDGMAIATKEATTDVKVVAKFVGPIQQTVSSQRMGTNTTTDIGYGIAIENDFARGKGVNLLSPYRHILFARSLNISDADAARIWREGNIYTITLWHDEIVAIAGPRGPIISFDDYIARASNQQTVWLLVSVALVVLAVSFWFIAGKSLGKQIPTAPPSPHV